MCPPQDSEDLKDLMEAFWILWKQKSAFLGLSEVLLRPPQASEVSRRCFFKPQVHRQDMGWQPPQGKVPDKMYPPSPLCYATGLTNCEGTIVNHTLYSSNEQVKQTNQQKDELRVGENAVISFIKN